MAQPPRPTPALLTNKQIVVVVVVLAALSAVTWTFSSDIGLFFLVGTVLFALWIGILTPLAYRNARKHGEWPPKDRSA
ncbi:hypothetical protein G7072_19390 [Nocardioides sp. HDW12B]|uniref:hypothetical protein n=1 Tax=Nocardioides sp. HDW12B TaxID=2714939 RepID=UPI00140BFEC3|nr:hypothetical protein [Nocardioides sp. HDW12B]QIK68214.1 hypothetical protein G7072_19390 [Nocardioides sp. HDW12B]